MPTALQEALLEFGLLHAFRTQPPGEQLRHVRTIESSGTVEDERERIAAVLDELAGYSFISALDTQTLKGMA
jgi:hypothetical protein